MFTKLGNHKTKAVALSLIPAYADQFVAKSRAVPVVTDLFNTKNLDMNFPELLKLCLNVTLRPNAEVFRQCRPPIYVDLCSMGQRVSPITCLRHRVGRPRITSN